jgi:hypothetical protein
MNFKPWYRREEFALMREILEDGETLPLSFDDWEENAVSELKVHGANAVIPVFIGSEEFFSFCEEKKISPNTANLAAFADSRGAATYSLGM